jgi:hypothetical protein
MIEIEYLKKEIYVLGSTPCEMCGRLKVEMGALERQL